MAESSGASAAPHGVPALSRSSTGSVADPPGAAPPGNGAAPAATAPDPDGSGGTDPDSTGEAENDAAIEDLEQELSVLWRRARSSSLQIARQIHPDMEPSAYGLMVLLQQQGPMRLTDLASAVGVGKPSLSRQVAMLQSLGLVEKHTDPVDGRAQPINLTAQGATRLEATASVRKEHFRRTWTGWEAQDLRTLVRLLHKLNASARPEHASGADPRRPAED